MTTKKPVQLTDNKKPQVQVEQTNANTSPSTNTGLDQTPTTQDQEQFCTCCKPGEWADFFNKKKTQDMFCPEVFGPELNLSANPTKFKSHKIFVKKNDI